MRIPGVPFRRLLTHPSALAAVESTDGVKSRRPLARYLQSGIGGGGGGNPSTAASAYVSGEMAGIGGREKLNQ